MSANVETSSHRKPRIERRCLVLAVALVLGLAVRVWLLAAYRGAVYVDNAKVALMAMHALHGRFYAFFWGQPHRVLGIAGHRRGVRDLGGR